MIDSMSFTLIFCSNMVTWVSWVRQVSAWRRKVVLMVSLVRLSRSSTVVSPGTVTPPKVTSQV